MNGELLPAEPTQPEVPPFWNRTALLRDESFDDGGLRLAVAIAKGVGFERPQPQEPGLCQAARVGRLTLFTDVRLLREAALIQLGRRRELPFYLPWPSLLWAVNKGVELDGFERLRATAELWDERKKRFHRPEA